MTRRTPGRTAGYDNRRPIRSPFIPLRNTPITGWNKPDRYTSRLTAQRARYHHEIRARSGTHPRSQPPGTPPLVAFIGSGWTRSEVPTTLCDSLLSNSCVSEFRAVSARAARRHPGAVLRRHYAVRDWAPFREPGPSVSDSALICARFLRSATTAVLCYVAQCSQVRADVVGVGDAEVGVERQGVLPVLAGQAVLACCVASVSETGVGAGLLVPVTGLGGQGERGRSEEH